MYISLIEMKFCKSKITMKDRRLVDYLKFRINGILQKKFDESAYLLSRFD